MQVAHLQEARFTIASSASSGTATLSGFSDLSRTFVFGASWQVAPGQSPVLSSNVEVDCWASSLTEVRAERWNSPAYQIDITAPVLQVGSRATVQKGSVTLSSSETSKAVTITSVTQANSLIYATQKNEGETAPGDDSDPDGRYVSFRFTSSTEITFERGAAKGAVTLHWTVVEDSGLDVQHVSFVRTSDSDATETVTITSVDTAKSFLIISQDTDEPTYNDESGWAVDLQNATTVRLRRGFSASQSDNFYIQVVEIADSSVQRGETTAHQSGTSITAVDTSRSIVMSGASRCGWISSSEYLDGNLDGRYWETWFVTSSTIAMESGETSALTDTVYTWEVVEFAAEDVAASPAGFFGSFF